MCALNVEELEGEIAVVVHSIVHMLILTSDCRSGWAAKFARCELEVALVYREWMCLASVFCLLSQLVSMDTGTPFHVDEQELNRPKFSNPILNLSLQTNDHCPNTISSKRAQSNRKHPRATFFFSKILRSVSKILKSKFEFFAVVNCSLVIRTHFQFWLFYQLEFSGWPSSRSSIRSY